MQAYLTLVRRELGGYMNSLTGYVIIASVLLLLGFSFTDMLVKLNATPTYVPLTELFYSSYYFWLILLLTAPIITMRSFALEKFSGTYETLMTVAAKTCYLHATLGLTLPPEITVEHGEQAAA